MMKGNDKENILGIEEPFNLSVFSLKIAKYPLPSTENLSTNGEANHTKPPFLTFYLLTAQHKKLVICPYPISGSDGNPLPLFLFLE